MENEEWGIGNREQEMQNEEWGMGNVEQRTGNGEGMGNTE